MRGRYSPLCIYSVALSNVTSHSQSKIYIRIVIFLRIDKIFLRAKMKRIWLFLLNNKKKIAARRFVFAFPLSFRFRSPFVFQRQPITVEKESKIEFNSNIEPSPFVSSLNSQLSPSQKSLLKIIHSKQHISIKMPSANVLRFAKLTEFASSPVRGSEFAAGCDLKR